MGMVVIPIKTIIDCYHRTVMFSWPNIHLLSYCANLILTVRAANLSISFSMPLLLLPSRANLCAAVAVGTEGFVYSAAVSTGLLGVDGMLWLVSRTFSISLSVEV